MAVVLGAPGAAVPAAVVSDGRAGAAGPVVFARRELSTRAAACRVADSAESRWPFARVVAESRRSRAVESAESAWPGASDTVVSTCFRPDVIDPLTVPRSLLQATVSATSAMATHRVIIMVPPG